MNTEVQIVKKGRGRPTVDKDQQQIDTFKSNVFTRDFKNTDGTVDRWYYDFNKFPTKGLYKTEMDVFEKYEKMPKYSSKEIEGFLKKSKGEKVTIDDMDKNDLVNNLSVKKTKRLYIHPTNGKIISYTRAHNLGII